VGGLIEVAEGSRGDAIAETVAFFRIVRKGRGHAGARLQIADADEPMDFIRYVTDTGGPTCRRTPNHGRVLLHRRHGDRGDLNACREQEPAFRYWPRPITWHTARRTTMTTDLSTICQLAD
jgi:hypothetical protein